MITTTRLTTSVIAFAVAFLMAAPTSHGFLPTPWESPNNVMDRLHHIENLLSSPDFIRSRTQLQKVDGDPVPELINVATNRLARPLVRVRAIRCLSLYRDIRVRRALQKMVVDREPDRYFMVTSMAYLEAFGEEAVLDLQPYLEHRDPKVRAAIARGFGLFGGEVGFYLLLEKRRTETDAKVLAAMRPFLQ